MATVDLTLDTSRPQGQLLRVDARQGDTALVLRLSIESDGDYYDFAGKYLEVAFASRTGTWSRVSNGQREGNSNVWTVPVPEQVTANRGTLLCYACIRNSADDSFRDSTQRFELHLEPSATYNADITDYSDEVDKLIRELETLLGTYASYLSILRNSTDAKINSLIAQLEKQITDLARSRLQNYVDEYLEMRLQQIIAQKVDGYVQASVAEHVESYLATHPMASIPSAILAQIFGR